MDGIQYSSSVALEACARLVDAIGECTDCKGTGKLHEDGCGRCGGLGVVIESVGMIMSEALPLALDALGADNKSFEERLRRLFKKVHWVGSAQGGGQ